MAEPNLTELGPKMGNTKKKTEGFIILTSSKSEFSHLRSWKKQMFDICPLNINVYFLLDSSYATFYTSMSDMNMSSKITS